MTIQFFHHGNTIGEVTMDANDSEDDVRLFAASSMRLPVARVLRAATANGNEAILFHQDDADRTITAWRVITN